jgi:spore coat polysaccharide biosynthesis protein SpsF
MNKKISTNTDTSYTGFITVRTTSSRLPNKCLLPLGQETVISHVIKRTLNFGIKPILCTSRDSSDDILEEMANQLNVSCFRGSMDNKLQRWYDCAEEFKINHFHTIDADDPFFDGAEMIESLNLLASKDYDVICPTESSSSGGASVGYSLTKDIVKQAIKGTNYDTDTEMMWGYLEKIKDIKMINLPESPRDDLKLRLTLDYDEDYWLLSSLARILGNDASRSQITEFFLINPDFRKINYFRNDEWKNAQSNKLINT